MATTYEPIATITVSGSPTSVSFTSISGNYTDLVIVCSVQSNQTGSSSNGMRIRYNDDTGSNYSYTEIYGDGTTAGSGRLSNSTYWDGGVISQVSATSPALNIINIMNYSNTTTHKTAISRNNFAGSTTGSMVGLWRSTSAITKITLYRDLTNTLKDGSTFTLYGIKAA